MTHIYSIRVYRSVLPRKSIPGILARHIQKAEIFYDGWPRGDDRFVLLGDQSLLFFFHTTCTELLLTAGRTYWMSKQLKTLYGPYFRPRSYTFLGVWYVPNSFESLQRCSLTLSFLFRSVDSGMVLTVTLTADLELSIVSVPYHFVFLSILTLTLKNIVISKLSAISYRK